MASNPTEFKLRKIQTRLGPIALVTMDNGEDWQKPNTFGEAALLVDTASADRAQALAER